MVRSRLLHALMTALMTALTVLVATSALASAQATPMPAGHSSLYAHPQATVVFAAAASMTTARATTPSRPAIQMRTQIQPLTPRAVTIAPMPASATRTHPLTSRRQANASTSASAARDDATTKRRHRTNVAHPTRSSGLIAIAGGIAQGSAGFLPPLCTTSTCDSGGSGGIIANGYRTLNSDATDARKDAAKPEENTAESDSRPVNALNNTTPSTAVNQPGSDAGDPPPPGVIAVNWGPGNPAYDNSRVVS